MEIKKMGNIKIAYRKGTPDENVIAESFELDLFISNVPEYIPKPDDVIIDIGAHIGAFSVLAATMAIKGKVYALEPCADSYKYLQYNVELNKLRNVFTHKLALSDKRGKTRLFYDLENGNWGHSITKSFSDLGEDVSTLTFNEFLCENHIEHCNFCKINCEGAEFNIILNTPKDILQKINVLLICYHSDLVENYNETNLCEHLENSNFSTRICNKDEMRGWIIAVNNNYKLPPVKVFLKKLNRIKRKIADRMKSKLKNICN